jgi:hypothetical protein
MTQGHKARWGHGHHHCEGPRLAGDQNPTWAMQRADVIDRCLAGSCCSRCEHWRMAGSFSSASTVHALHSCWSCCYALSRAVCCSGLLSCRPLSPPSEKRKVSRLLPHPPQHSAGKTPGIWKDTSWAITPLQTQRSDDLPSPCRAQGFCLAALQTTAV